MPEPVGHGDEEHGLWIRKRLRHNTQLPRRKTEVRKTDLGAARVQQANHYFFPVVGRQRRNPKVEPVWPDSHHDPSILGRTPLSDVHIGKDLDSGNQRLLHLHGNLHQVAQNAIHPKANDRSACLRIDVNITCFLVCRGSDNAGKEPDSRRALVRPGRIKFSDRFLFAPAHFVAQKLDNRGVFQINLEQPVPVGFGQFCSDLPIMFIDRRIDFGGKAEPRRDLHAGDEAQFVHHGQILWLSHDHDKPLPFDRDWEDATTRGNTTGNEA